MKKYIIILASILTLMSCNNYLSVDKYLNDMLDEETVFTNKNYTQRWLWGTYAYLNEGGIEIAKGYTCLNFASDDVIYGDWDNYDQQYQNGQFGPTALLNENRWNFLYQGIRKATVFINNIDKCTELKADEREDMRGQARFLRAYFYWLLIKQWGPVPIMPDKEISTALSYDKLAVARNTYDECVDYISNELVLAAQVMNPRSTSWLGQATVGAALATRAKVLLYAASPLYNGNKDLYNLKNKDGKQLINQEYNEEKWARAAAAAKEVIDLQQYELFTVVADVNTLPLASNCPTATYPNGCGGIDPIQSYVQLFNGATPVSYNSEIIFFGPGQHMAEDFVRHSMPRESNGYNTISVTQKQVDAYLMKDGKPISSPSTNYPYYTSGFTTNNTTYKPLPSGVFLEYANREPRFYASIAYNGSIWENLSAPGGSSKNIQVFYYKGKTSGKSPSESNFYLRTGIGNKKYYNPNDSWVTDGKQIAKIEPRIRYADVLLWYAEALNELTSTHIITSTYTGQDIEVSRNPNEMRYALSRVRFRAGLPDEDVTIYGDVNLFRKAIKRERQVELFMENARYFDLRRWKDALEEENKPIMGLNVDVTETSKNNFFSPKVPSNMRKVFLSKMYLWPIAQDEINKNELLVQNQGWE